MGNNQQFQSWGNTGNILETSWQSHFFGTRIWDYNGTFSILRRHGTWQWAVLHFVSWWEPNEPKLPGFEASTIFPRKSPSMAPFLLRLFALLFRGTFTPGSVKQLVLMSQFCGLKERLSSQPVCFNLWENRRTTLFFENCLWEFKVLSHKLEYPTPPCHIYSIACGTSTDQDVWLVAQTLVVSVGWCAIHSLAR